jgi:hypothetical protein
MSLSAPTLDDMPRLESIRTKPDVRREQRKAMYAGARKSHCYKHAYTRKQALTQANTLMNEGAPYLRTYKCERCGCWHLTHQAQRSR